MVVIKISIEEEVFGTDGFLAEKSLEAEFDDGNLSLNLFDSAEFEPQAYILVQTEIDVEGDDDGDFVSLDIFEQRFSQVSVPEPSTLTLLGIGLVGLGLMGRRRKNVQLQGLLILESHIHPALCGDFFCLPGDPSRV